MKEVQVTVKFHVKQFHANSTFPIHPLKPGGRVVYYEDGTLLSARVVTILRVIDDETLVLLVGAVDGVTATWDTHDQQRALLGEPPRKPGSWDYVV